MSYINIFYIFIVLAAALLIAAVILFFALDIPDAFRIVNKKPLKNNRKSKKIVKSDSIHNVKNSTKKRNISDNNNKQLNSRKKTTVLETQEPINKKTTVLRNTTSKITGEIKPENNESGFEIIETEHYKASDEIVE